jgi:hypothetical protein
MTDISKCDGKNCELKDKCWRFNAPDSYQQAYFNPQKRGKDCEYLWDRGELNR